MADDHANQRRDDVPPTAAVNPIATQHDRSSGRGADPFDDPSFDVQEYLDQVLEDLNRCDPVTLRRMELREWASAAGFENIELRYLGETDYWELRCSRGTNGECINATHAERWVGYIARGCASQIEPGQIVAIVEGYQIAARFRLTPRNQSSR